LRDSPSSAGTRCRDIIPPAVIPQDLPTLYPAQAARLRGRVRGDGTLTADLSCRRCAYNLRGLHLGGRFPECSAPVEASVRGDELVSADPHWLRGLQRGAQLLVAGWFTAAVTAFSSLVLASRATVTGIGLELLSFLVAGASIPLMLCGTWMLTRGDPAGTGEPGYGRWRRAAKALSLVGCFTPAVVALGATVSRDSFFGGPALKRLFWAVAVAAFVGMMLLLVYLKRMVARRMPDRELEDKLTFALQMMAGGTGALVVAAGISWAVPAGAAKAAACWLAVPLLLIAAGGFAGAAAVWKFGSLPRLRKRPADSDFRSTGNPLCSYNERNARGSPRHHPPTPIQPVRHGLGHRRPRVAAGRIVRLRRGRGPVRRRGDPDARHV